MSTKEKIAWGCIAVAFAVFVGGVCLTIYNSTGTNAESWNEPGVRGDFWGGHSGFTWGGTGAFLLLAAVMFQSHELELQRDEIRESRIIAEKQASELNKQNEMAGIRDDQRRMEILSETMAKLSSEAHRFPVLRMVANIVGLRATTNPQAALDLLSLFWLTIRTGISFNNLPDEMEDELESMVVNRYPQLRRVSVDPHTHKEVDVQEDGTEWLKAAKRILINRWPN